MSPRADGPRATPGIFHSIIIAITYSPIGPLPRPSHTLLCSPSALPSRLIPLSEVFHAPYPFPKPTSGLDDAPDLFPLILVSKDVAPPPIQASTMISPLAEVDVALGMLSCEVQH